MAKRCTKISAGQICHMQYNISSFQVSPGFGSGEYNVSEGSGSVTVLPCPDEENKTSFEMFYEHCFRCEVKDPHYHEFHALANQLTYTCIHIGAFQHLVTHISQLACRCKT